MRFQFIHAADLHIDSPLAALGAKDAARRCDLRRGRPLGGRAADRRDDRQRREIPHRRRRRVRRRLARRLDRPVLRARTRQAASRRRQDLPHQRQSRRREPHVARARATRERACVRRPQGPDAAHRGLARGAARTQLSRARDARRISCRATRRSAATAGSTSACCTPASTARRATTPTRPARRTISPASATITGRSAISTPPQIVAPRPLDRLSRQSAGPQPSRDRAEGRHAGDGRGRPHRRGGADHARRRALGARARRRHRASNTRRRSWRGSARRSPPPHAAAEGRPLARAADPDRRDAAPRAASSRAASDLHDEARGARGAASPATCWVERLRVETRAPAAAAAPDGDALDVASLAGGGGERSGVLAAVAELAASVADKLPRDLRDAFLAVDRGDGRRSRAISCAGRARMRLERLDLAPYGRFANQFPALLARRGAACRARRQRVRQDDDAVGDRRPALRIPAETPRYAFAARSAIAAGRRRVPPSPTARGSKFAAGRATRTRCSTPTTGRSRRSRCGAALGGVDRETFETEFGLTAPALRERRRGAAQSPAARSPKRWRRVRPRSAR